MMLGQEELLDFCVCVCSRDAKVLWQILLVRKEKESKKLLRIVVSGL